jgi:hypothetical protein
MRDALEATVVGLTTSGKILRRKKYRRASTSPQLWDDRSKADLDREFSIENITSDENMTFGGINELDYTGEFDLVIGHSKTGDLKEGERRRDTDLLHIRKNLEAKSNYPTAVWLIRQTNMDTRDLEKYWITTLTFNILYTVQAP